MPSPNCVKAELKSERKNASSMITLFTKSPLPEKVNTELLDKFGYLSSRGNKKKNFIQLLQLWNLTI